ncbi:hypothetical protein HPB47_020467 [Ixodes persulcatus]|uniref:Uncharacterized protein n=1 Tax=Ixodes persulcatus TaxID=34615 RepID=A0AC60QIN5_IXOPE|nr:hypothetical protein HPB47_020467 [Ixodes persulcatus]
MRHLLWCTITFAFFEKTGVSALSRLHWVNVRLLFLSSGVLRCLAVSSGWRRGLAGSFRRSSGYGGVAQRRFLRCHRGDGSLWLERPMHFFPDILGDGKGWRTTGGWQQPSHFLPDDLTDNVTDAGKLSPREVLSADLFRINSRSNTVSVNTDCPERVKAYTLIQRIMLKAMPVEVYGYAAEPTDTRRYVLPNVLSLDAVRTTEEIFDQVQLGNPHLEIVAARRMGRSKAILVTVGGNEPPSQEEPVEEVRRRKKARCPDSPEEDKTLTAITELATAVNTRFQQLDEHLTERFQKISQDSQDPLTRLEQWNGGGLRTKINAQLFSSETQPEVIATQECSENCKIPGYTRYEQSNGNTKKPIHTFVRRDIPVKQHDVTLQRRNGRLVVELLPKKKKQLSMVICNTYSSTKEHGTDVAEVFPAASSIAAGGPVVVLGDFNAPCIGWCYKHDTTKGKAIEKEASQCSMVLLNHLIHPARCGNSITRNTNPDLTYAANVSGATWSNTLETLGSDHYILKIRVDICRAAPRGVTISLLTDWDKFRDRRRNRGPIDLLKEWTNQLNDDQRAVTREVSDATQAKSVHTKLTHMLEAYASLHGRWKTTGKNNRKLRRRLALLFRDIEQHAAYLTEQQWTQMCDRLKGQLHTRSPWSLFRHLLNLDESKLEHNKALISLLRELPGDEASICSELRKRNLEAPALQVSPSQRYEGDPVGFRQHLSTQDVFLQLSTDFFSNQRPWKCLAALDLRKAFDRVSHKSILDQISRLNLGGRAYTYVEAFLTGRTAEIKLGDYESDTFPTCLGRGTPQGAVISPFLFNLAIAPVSRRLEQIPHIKHAVYADDIILWTNAPPFIMTPTLQAGADAVAEVPQSVGLECSPEKSALLLASRLRDKEALAKVFVFMDGQAVPNVPATRVLGMPLHTNRSTEIVRRTLRKNTDNTTRLIRRAFVLIRVTYAAPYMHLPKTARKQIDAIIRKSYKVALVLTNHTAAQISRLSRTPTGRRTLHRAGIDYKDVPPPKWDMQPDWRRAVVVRPLRRNMSTTHHKQRREARARALQRLQKDDPRAFHVDASSYPDRSKRYIAAVHNISGSYTATIKACDIHEAEEAAIAIGLLAASRTGSRGSITTDSKTAATSFLYGRIGSPARKILRSLHAFRDKNSRYHGNEAAHSLASRVATSRDCEKEGGRAFSLGKHCYAAPAMEEAPRNSAMPHKLKERGDVFSRHHTRSSPTSKPGDGGNFRHSPSRPHDSFIEFTPYSSMGPVRDAVVPKTHPQMAQSDICFGHARSFNPHRNSKVTSMTEKKTSFLTGRPLCSQMCCTSSCS